ncbi:MAG: hypothetical protein PHI11_13535 [Gallionella sp.]|nr:hypothetical protein [Gallionella sp.]
MKNISFAVIAFFIGFVSMWLVSAYNKSGEYHTLPPGQELNRQVSPNKSLVAFVWLPDIGDSVMVSQPYQIWVESLRPAEKQLVLEADKTDSLLMTWRSPELLEICYSNAQIYHFWNSFLAIEQNSSERQEVEIVLRKVQSMKDCKIQNL